MNPLVVTHAELEPFFIRDLANMVVSYMWPAELVTLLLHMHGHNDMPKAWFVERLIDLQLKHVVRPHFGCYEYMDVCQTKDEETLAIKEFFFEFPSTPPQPWLSRIVRCSCHTWNPEIFRDTTVDFGFNSIFVRSYARRNRTDEEQLLVNKLRIFAAPWISQVSACLEATFGDGWGRVSGTEDL